QGFAPFVAERLIRGVARSVEEQRVLLPLRNGLLEHARAAGEAPCRGQMRGELAEGGQVLELGLEGIDVVLVLVVGKAVDGIEYARRIGLSESADRRCHAIAGALSVDGCACFVVVVIALVV